MAKPKKSNPVKETIQYIQKTQENIPIWLFEYKNMQEKAIYETKQTIINEKGTEEAFKYLNTSNGIIDYQEKFKENITNQVLDIFKPTKDLNPMHLSNMAAMYLPNEEKMTEVLSKTGSNFDFAIYNEHLLQPMMKQQAQKLQTQLYKFDSDLIPEIGKKIGLNKHLTSYEAVNQAQIANLVTTWNKGGTPLGTDHIKQVGLEQYLK